jgi:hypothetical protein
MGHAMRCERLIDELKRRGHQHVRNNADVFIYDYPTMDSWMDCWQPVKVKMGMYGSTDDSCWGWRPLSDPHPRTLTGLRYAILDPALWQYENRDSTGSILVTMGGADTEHHTELVLDALSDDPDSVVRVVQGPNFKRSLEPRTSRQTIYTDLDRLDFLSMLAVAGDVICAWGTTALEAAYLKCRVFVVARYEWQMRESWSVNLPTYYPFDAWQRLRDGQRGQRMYETVRKEIDLDGVDRTVDWLEMLHRVYGGGE